jgi:hypothetical protein
MFDDEIQRISVLASVVERLAAMQERSGTLEIARDRLEEALMVLASTLLDDEREKRRLRKPTVETVGSVA